MFLLGRPPLSFWVKYLLADVVIYAQLLGLRVGALHDQLLLDPRRNWKT